MAADAAAAAGCGHFCVFCDDSGGGDDGDGGGSIVDGDEGKILDGVCRTKSSSSRSSNSARHFTAESWRPFIYYVSIFFSGFLTPSPLFNQKCSTESMQKLQLLDPLPLYKCKSNL